MVWLYVSDLDEEKVAFCLYLCPYLDPEPAGLDVTHAVVDVHEEQLALDKDRVLEGTQAEDVDILGRPEVDNERNEHKDLVALKDHILDSLDRLEGMLQEVGILVLADLGELEASVQVLLDKLEELHVIVVLGEWLEVLVAGLDVDLLEPWQEDILVVGSSTADSNHNVLVQLVHMGPEPVQLVQLVVPALLELFVAGQFGVQALLAAVEDKHRLHKDQLEAVKPAEEERLDQVEDIHMAHF